jgi:hypothetical protein
MFLQGLMFYLRQRFCFVGQDAASKRRHCRNTNVRVNLSERHMQKYFKHFTALVLFYFVMSCGNEPIQTKSDTVNMVQAGKQWLKSGIESFFNDTNNFLTGFSCLCTQQYAEFKDDATNIGLDGGLTEAEFQTKWGRRYSKHAGIGEGFMVAGTDFGIIEVKKCDFKNVTEMNNLLYDVLIIDKTFHSKFTRQVALTKAKNSFLIDDVKEISNEFMPRE